jgi:hypothetical protein
MAAGQVAAVELHALPVAGNGQPHLVDISVRALVFNCVS